MRVLQAVEVMGVMNDRKGGFAVSQCFFHGSLTDVHNLLCQDLWYFPPFFTTPG